MIKRTNSELTQICLEYAGRDNDIRAVLQEGSGANPNSEVDKYSDLDIVFVTLDNTPYVKRGMELASQFGKIAILQEPHNADLWSDVSVSNSDVYSYLMQFADGSRIDLTFNSLSFLLRDPNPCESATLVLLDKDGAFDWLPPASDRDYLTKRPTAAEYRACCNEFWWCAPYVFKAVARRQMLHAFECLNGRLRFEFIKMLTWLAAVNTNFFVNLGKHSTDIAPHIEPTYYNALLASYPHADFAEIITVTQELIKTFPKVAEEVGATLGYEYDGAEGERTVAVIKFMYGHLLG